MTTTPPPRSTRALTPPTPLHGPMHDSPRRSSRIHSRSKYSPKLPSHDLAQRKRQIRPTSSQTLSPPSSPISPLYTGATRSRVGMPSDDDPLSFDPRPRTGVMEPETLPTPSKTPRKRPHHAHASTARVLFPSHATDDLEDVMPTPKKSRVGKKHLAFTLESFEEQAKNGAEVQIYTDSKERVPEVDDGEDNPFNATIKKPAVSKQAAGTPKPRRTYGMGKEIDDAVHNNEGMVFTFRGRKMYRPFAEDEQHETSEAEDELGAGDEEQRSLRRQAGPDARRRFTRSTVKPRVLFPAQSGNDSADDLAAEEDETDIDVNQSAMATLAEDCQGSADDEITAATPIKDQRFVPMTPPTTMRKTKSSPFDVWPRTKSVGRAAAGTKHSLEVPDWGMRSKRSRSAQPEVPQ